MKERKMGLMTSGNIYKQIILFSIPLLLGNFFQLMYNTIDSVVVGNYVGSTALAAVGASTPIINLLIAFFIGLSTGAGVVVSRYFGANKDESVSQTVHTFVLFSILFGICLTLVGVFMSPIFLKWMATPSDTIVEAETYLCIYFLGSVFQTVYNGGTGILQAVGDSKTPLYILIASSILNIILDILFVVSFNMGVSGVAWATILSQCLSMICVMSVLMKKKESYGVHLRKLHINGSYLKEIVNIGVPAGLQGMVVSVSNVIVMGYINGFGSASVAGFTSANKFDNFLGLPVNSFSLAVTTFVGQNLGAGQYHRVKEGVRDTLILSNATVISLGIVVFCFAETCISFFSKDVEVIKAGATCIRVMCPFYFALCFHQVYSGALRASGRSSIPMITSIVSFVFIRQIFLMIFIPIYHDISIIGWGYSLTWIFAAAFTSWYYFQSNWLKNEQIHQRVKND